MTGDLDFQYDAATCIKARFYTAQSDLEEDAATMPSEVDGGNGTEHIDNMIAQLAEDAGTLAQAATLGGDNMGSAIDLVTGVDEDVARTFRNMEKEMP